ncbi:hypothetical protein PGB90_009182 [Kerria lacca]
MKVLKRKDVCEEQQDRCKVKKENDSRYDWGKTKKEKETKSVKEKEKPNFETTGKLTEDTNSFRGVVIKYSEPEEARIPKKRWRLYPFKGEKMLPVLHMHRQSGYLIGRDRKIADLAVDHPSCSKQHAAFQFRSVSIKTDLGTTVQQIRPYIMDLDSANGTFLNNKKIEPRKYYELLEKDVLKFGYSSREYVLMHDEHQPKNEDDDLDIDTK